MDLNISSLIKAISSLERSINVVAKIDKNTDADQMETLRAGVIQAFEFSYELCWKFMKRWIEINVSSESVDGVTRIELFRVSAENRLIVDVTKWMEFHRARNKTSHIYDEDVAFDVFNTSVEFLPFAKDFLKRLEQRL
jgi:nucleotidyltransferase substrate binding protein (TIGR01987 family)